MEDVVADLVVARLALVVEGVTRGEQRVREHTQRPHVHRAAEVAPLAGPPVRRAERAAGARGRSHAVFTAPFWRPRFRIVAGAPLHVLATTQPPKLLYLSVF